MNELPQIKIYPQTLQNGFTFDMIRVEGGSFQMGGADKELMILKSLSMKYKSLLSISVNIPLPRSYGKPSWGITLRSIKALRIP